LYGRRSVPAQGICYNVRLLHRGPLCNESPVADFHRVPATRVVGTFEVGPSRVWFRAGADQSPAPHNRPAAAGESVTCPQRTFQQSRQFCSGSTDARYTATTAGASRPRCNSGGGASARSRLCDHTRASRCRHVVPTSNQHSIWQMDG
jgi:hypothetical protein